MPSVLISGANRGIGLELVRQYAAAGWKVIATCRNLGDAAELNALRGDVRVEPLDVSSRSSVGALGAALAGVPLDVVISNAGICPSESNVAVERIDREHWVEVLAVNAFGALAVATALRANLELGREKKLVAITSKLSSQALNETGQLPVYRASKSALNALWRSLAAEWRPLGIACVLIHPGLVQTRLMSQANMSGGIDVTASASGIRATVERVRLADSGRFYSYDGPEIPW
jgi:NAD(P)-dependent dehydrogenase (short-subunit alcohol dehydrogenase family)